MLITFTFDGGPFEGSHVYDSAKPKHQLTFEEQLIRGFYVLSQKGQVGKRFGGASPYAMEHMRTAPIEEMPATSPHYYEIVNRMSYSEGVIIQCKYMGTTKPPPREESSSE